MAEVVILTREQVCVASRVGVLRKAMHLYWMFEKGESNGLGQRGGKDLDKWNEVESANAELAVATFTHRYWVGDWENKVKTVDVRPDIEVRYTTHGHGNLLLYETDDPSRRYVLVNGSIPQFKLVGWIFGHEGIKSQYLKKLREDRPAFYVIDVKLLRDPKELINNG